MRAGLHRGDPGHVARRSTTRSAPAWPTDGRVRLGTERPGHRSGPLISRASTAGGRFVDARSCGARWSVGGPSRRQLQWRLTTSPPWSSTPRPRRRSWPSGVRPGAGVLPFDRTTSPSRWPTKPPRAGASAWTRKSYRALRATREIAAGCVWVNDTSRSPRSRTAATAPPGSARNVRLLARGYTNVKPVMAERSGTARKAWHRTSSPESTGTARSRARHFAESTPGGT